MSISEPEPWSFNNGDDQFKKYESAESSTDDSDDEEMFSKRVKTKGKNFKKIVERRRETVVRMIFFPRLTSITTMSAAIETVNLVSQELSVPDPQLHRRGFLLRRRDVLDGLRSLVHHPGREGSRATAARQYVLTALLTTLLSVVVFLVVSCRQPPRRQARPARLRDHPLSGLPLTHRQYQQDTCENDQAVM